MLAVFNLQVGLISTTMMQWHDMTCRSVHFYWSGYYWLIHSFIHSFILANLNRTERYPTLCSIVSRTPNIRILTDYYIQAQVPMILLFFIVRRLYILLFSSHGSIRLGVKLILWGNSFESQSRTFTKSCNDSLITEVSRCWLDLTVSLDEWHETEPGFKSPKEISRIYFFLLFSHVCRL
jgi:hypothetical protein